LDREPQELLGYEFDANYGTPYVKKKSVSTTFPTFCGPCAATPDSELAYQVAKSIAGNNPIHVPQGQVPQGLPLQMPQVQQPLPVPIQEPFQQPFLSPSPSPSPSADPYYKPKCLINNQAFGIKSIFPCMWNTMQAIFYDFDHWGQLPKSGFGSKLSYTLGRDDRPFYLILWVLAMLIFILILWLIFGGHRRHIHGVNPLYQQHIYNPYNPYMVPPANPAFQQAYRCPPCAPCAACPQCPQCPPPAVVARA